MWIFTQPWRKIYCLNPHKTIRFVKPSCNIFCNILLSSVKKYVLRSMELMWLKTRYLALDGTMFWWIKRLGMMCSCQRQQRPKRHVACYAMRWQLQVCMVRTSWEENKTENNKLFKKKSCWLLQDHNPHNNSLFPYSFIITNKRVTKSSHWDWIIVTKQRR